MRRVLEAAAAAAAAVALHGWGAAQLQAAVPVSDPPKPTRAIEMASAELSALADAWSAPAPEDSATAAAQDSESQTEAPPDPAQPVDSQAGIDPVVPSAQDSNDAPEASETAQETPEPTDAPDAGETPETAVVEPENTPRPNITEPENTVAPEAPPPPPVAEPLAPNEAPSTQPVLDDLRAVAPRSASPEMAALQAVQTPPPPRLRPRRPSAAAPVLDAAPDAALQTDAAHAAPAPPRLRPLRTQAASLPAPAPPPLETPLIERVSELPAPAMEAVIAQPQSSQTSALAVTPETPKTTFVETPVAAPISPMAPAFAAPVFESVSEPVFKPIASLETPAPALAAAPFAPMRPIAPTPITQPAPITSQPFTPVQNAPQTANVSDFALTPPLNDEASGVLVSPSQPSLAEPLARLAQPQIQNQPQNQPHSQPSQLRDFAVSAGRYAPPAPPPVAETAAVGRAVAQRDFGRHAAPAFNAAPAFSGAAPTSVSAPALARPSAASSSRTAPSSAFAAPRDAGAPVPAVRRQSRQSAPGQTTPRQVPSRQAAPRQARPAVPAPSPAQTGGSGADLAGARQGYGRRIQAIIERKKVYPPRARRRGDQGTVLVRFQLNSTGAVVETAVARGSGSARLDAAAVKLVRDSIGAFPPPPAGLTGDALKFEIPIRYQIR